MKENKRITFGQYEAAFLFEWYQAVHTVNPMMCTCCPPISKRLRKFVGEKTAKCIIRNVKRNPYVAKLK